MAAPFRVRVPARRHATAGLQPAEVRAVATASALYVRGGGGYNGARSDKAALKNWHTMAGSADGDTLGDLETLRARSRDLERNNPLASGALSTEVTNVIGSGIWPCAAVDADILGIAEEEAEAFGRRAEALFVQWGESTSCDAARSVNFAGLQAIAFRGELANGDHFVLRRLIRRPGAVLGLALQMIEADRVANPSHVPETLACAAGIEVDRNGAPVRAWVSSGHPGAAPPWPCPVAPSRQSRPEGRGRRGRARRP